MYRKVCLVGFDRVVGSFALGLKRIGFRGSIVGVAEPAIISECWKLGLIQDGTQDLAKAMVGADLVMLSSQSGHSCSQLAAVLEHADDGATISEMTRVKGDVKELFESRQRSDVHYVGFRLLGDTSSDGDASESNRFFFENKTVILTPRGKDDLEAFSTLQDVTKRMGANVVAMSPQAHDRLLAVLSQVPKTAMVAIIQSMMNDNAGLKIQPEMLGQRMLDEIQDLAALRKSDWVQDMAANRELVLQGIDSLLDHLKRIKDSIRNGTLERELDALIELSGFALNLSGPADTKADLVLVAGQDMKVLEKASEMMAKARITIGALERMEDAEPGTYRLSLKSSDERNRALTMLRHAGINVELLA
ncbi:MAG TPA: prephenate dehydrogenase/arogenate dehydrogenase family protein [bacterium]|jgi:prephenate dehydrogenase/3-phosphoshikimate 1-carboxyvinyltransferase